MVSATVPFLRGVICWWRKVAGIGDRGGACRTGWLILLLGLSATMVGCGGRTGSLDAGPTVNDAGLSDAGPADASPDEDAACLGAGTSSADFACYVDYENPCSCRHGSRYGICTCGDLSMRYFDGCPCCPSESQALSLCADAN